MGKCCCGMKCNEKGYCVNNNCKKTGTLPIMMTPALTMVLNGTVMYAEGQECYSTNNIASPNCTDGSLCNVETNICYRATGRKQVFYNQWLHLGCKVHADCDVGLDCISGMYINRPNDECSEKHKKNTPTCKYGENNCPNKCARSYGACGGKDSLSCCRELKCENQNWGICIDDPCKRSGTCIDDNDCCTNYGCVNGKVVWAAGWDCATTDNCTGGTVCTEGYTQNICIPSI